nr:PREDICTED: collectin-43-like [Latimeria chalumnae]|eukprot:XP_006013848.1 PREDICTED: collectin-43-like [Latimeria chalumnae]
MGEKVFSANGQEGHCETAETICHEAGGQQATPKNAAENKAIQEIVSIYNKKACCIGISDRKSEGMFEYLSGEQITYSNWKTGEPNNRKNEDCVEVDFDGKWNDVDCRSTSLIICEF